MLREPIFEHPFHPRANESADANQQTDQRTDEQIQAEIRRECCALARRPEYRSELKVKVDQFDRGKKRVSRGAHQREQGKSRNDARRGSTLRFVHRKRFFGYRGRIVSRNDLLFLDIQLLMLLTGDSACQETARRGE